MSDMPNFELEPDRIAVVNQITSQQWMETPRPWAKPVYVDQFHFKTHYHAMLAVRPFERHMTDEGWQLQQGMEAAGYMLFGNGWSGAGFPDAENIASRYGVMFVQDKREWSPDCGACFDKSAAFVNVPKLANIDSLFRVTVLKDLLFHQPETMKGHDELRPHVVVHYYHPDLVRWLAPWLANTPLIRTYHSLDPDAVPHFNPTTRAPCILSGAMNAVVYPLRQRIADACRRGELLSTTVLRHPGYGLIGNHTPDYLRTLSMHRVAICTSSIMGFALRKIIEATACGCKVITDLPVGDELPYIDGNLIRVSPNIPIDRLRAIIDSAADSWDAKAQQKFSDLAVDFYDYKRQCRSIARNIENTMRNYNNA